VIETEREKKKILFFCRNCFSGHPDFKYLKLKNFFLFSSSLLLRRAKLECVSLESLFGKAY
jgi:hypothetical protein